MNVALQNTVVLKKVIQFWLDFCKELSTNFSSTPYTVVAVKASKVTAQNESYSITRSLLFFKKIPSYLQSESDEMDDISAPTTTQSERNNDTQEIGPAAPTRRSARNRTQTEHYGFMDILSHQL